MKVVDLHPEDLLDKEARGELTETERERLDAHLERCTTCRFEREVRLDFAAELDGDEEEPISVQHLLALALPKTPVAEAPQHEPPLEDSNDEEVEEKPASESVRPKISIAPIIKRRRRTHAVLLVAAAVLVGGVATATNGGARAVWAKVAAVWSAPDLKATPTPRATPGAVATPVWTAATALTAPTPPTTDDPVIETAVIAPLPAAAPVVKATSAPAAQVDTAASLFESANQARRQGDYARALVIHRRLQISFPTSREAQVSHATVGRLLLDRGDATGALTSFDAYQARGAGPLDEAVMVGRATALERLGRMDEARVAWRALLTAFPDTPYAEHARARSVTP